VSAVDLLRSTADLEGVRMCLASRGRRSPAPTLVSVRECHRSYGDCSSGYVVRTLCRCSLSSRS
jgi:hypothetical protein